MTDHPLFRRVMEFIYRENLLQDIAHIEIALSGGADSVCLCAVLAAARRRAQIGVSLRAHHIRHGLRVSDAADAQTARNVAQMLGIPYIQTNLHLGAVSANVEESARNARYGALFRAMERQFLSSAALAVAHHGDENVETAVWRLGRGCGIEGLCLSPKRSIRGHAVIRPLLAVSKEEIYAFLRECGLPWAEDPTNADTHYLRNRIRQNILPLLHENAPAFSRSLINISHDAETVGALADWFVKNYQISSSVWVCPWDAWRAIPQSAQRQIIRHAALLLQPGLCPGQYWTESAVAMIARQNQRAMRNELGNLVCEWSCAGVSLYLKKQTADFSMDLPSPPFSRVEIQNLGRVSAFYATPQAKFQNTPGMICIRADVCHADALRILPASRFPIFHDANGKPTKMNEALRSQGVARACRPSWPVLCHGDAPLWILGGARTEAAMPCPPHAEGLFFQFER